MANLLDGSQSSSRMIGLRVETEVAMLKRTLHRAFALGWIGMFGVLMIPGPASGRTAQEELESIGIEPIAAEEGWEQDLTSEDEAALRAWVAFMENDDASPMEEDYPVKRSCLNNRTFVRSTRIAKFMGRMPSASSRTAARGNAAYAQIFSASSSSRAGAPTGARLTTRSWVVPSDSSIRSRKTTETPSHFASTGMASDNDHHGQGRNADRRGLP